MEAQRLAKERLPQVVSRYEEYQKDTIPRLLSWYVMGGVCREGCGALIKRVWCACGCGYVKEGVVCLRLCLWESGCGVAMGKRWVLYNV